jgi:hypothetical protein
MSNDNKVYNVTPSLSILAQILKTNKCKTWLYPKINLTFLREWIKLDHNPLIQPVRDLDPG